MDGGETKKEKYKRVCVCVILATCTFVKERLEASQ